MKYFKVHYEINTFIMVLITYVNFKTLKNLAISKQHLQMSIIKFVKPGIIFLLISIMQ